MKKIKLTQGKVALVDNEDYKFLMRWKWHARKSKRKNGNYVFYAARRAGKNYEKKEAIIFMHSIVFSTDKLIDHKDRNGLNNQKSNLRIATPSQNSKNKTAWGKSKYLGVSLNINKHSGLERWVATIFVNGKNKTLGKFKIEKAAALCYNKAAKKIHGEFANLNVI